LLKAEDFEAADAEFWSQAYWAFVKGGQKDRAPAAIERLSTLDKIESVLLQANLDSRERQYAKAEEGYRTALDLAATKDNRRDMGRAKHELAYIANMWGDRPLAEELYLSAIRLLEEAPPGLRDSRWSSALARALRDYADLLVTGEAEEGRLKEARGFLRRALAIHALDGRIVQTAYSFLTWGRLDLALRDPEIAEQRFQHAAILFHQYRNWYGWTQAITGIATAACRCNREEEGLAVLKLASDSVEDGNLRGELALEQSKIAMHLGRITDCCVYAQQAVKLLEAPPRLREAERLFQFSSALLSPVRSP
jgi:tetratricopeptide (TPR) repeat protein